MKIKTDIAKLLEESLSKYNSMGYADFLMLDYRHTMYEWLSKFLADDESFMLSNSELVNWFTLMIIEELSVDIEDILEDEYDKGYDHGYDSGYSNGCADTSYDD